MSIVVVSQTKKPRDLGTLLGPCNINTDEILTHADIKSCLCRVLTNSKQENSEN